MVTPLRSRILLFVAASLAVAGTWFLYGAGWPEPEREAKEAPSDWFYMQRAYPGERIDQAAYLSAAREAARMRSMARPNPNRPWRLMGPTNIGGRVTSIAVPLSDTMTIYAGTAAGGIFKSTNGGANWWPVFDDQPALSIGDIAIDPTNPDVIYAGTGEANGLRFYYGGMGVFKSTDAGETWRHMALEKTFSIGRIVVDSTDPRRIYVAAMGDPASADPNRGLYRSTDGGESWKQVLYDSDSVGCIDVAMHPAAPGRLFAAMWERKAVYGSRRYGGPRSALHRSTDGGDSWTRVDLGESKTLGRIGLAVAPSDPDRVYALAIDSIGFEEGVYGSRDGGRSWTRASSTAGVCNFYGWWFGQIRVHPARPEEIFTLGVILGRSADGGEIWNTTGFDMHADHHGLFIHPVHTWFRVIANDAGVYVSHNAGHSWDHCRNFPATQFYTCEIDPQLPERLYGGTQDNHVIRTLTGDPNDWHALIPAGDGFYVVVDPTNSDVVYFETQYGGFRYTKDGGRNNFGALGLDQFDRFNWNTPIVMDPNNTQVLYLGSHRMYRSTDGGEHWSPISGDLTSHNVKEFLSTIPFGTITTIAVARSNSQAIYAGTDDGNLWVTLDGGNLWKSISANLPKRWVTRLTVDPYDARIAYATFSGFAQRGNSAHVLKTTNAGESWSDISENLPNVPVTDILVDPEDPSLLYLSTDVGVFYRFGGDPLWKPLGTGLPGVPVTDLTLHKGTGTLVAATYGRSMFALDVSGLTGVERGERVSDGVLLRQEGPNPFSAATAPRYAIPAGEHGTLEIHTMDGRLLRSIGEPGSIRGEGLVHWDGLDAAGHRAPAGRYICRLRAGGRQRSIPLVLLR